MIDDQKKKEGDLEITHGVRLLLTVPSSRMNFDTSLRGKSDLKRASTFRKRCQKGGSNFIQNIIALRDIYRLVLRPKWTSSEVEKPMKGRHQHDGWSVRSNTPNYVTLCLLQCSANV